MAPGAGARPGAKTQKHYIWCVMPWQATTGSVSGLYFMLWHRPRSPWRFAGKSQEFLGPVAALQAAFLQLTGPGAHCLQALAAVLSLKAASLLDLSIYRQKFQQI
jgi:hypothetical protein